jgi:hypothetical protein
MRQVFCCIVLAMVLFGTSRVSANTEMLKTRAGSLVHWTGAEITVGLAPSGMSKTVSQGGVELAIQRAAQAWNEIRAGQPPLHFVTAPGPQVTVKFCRGQWRGDTVDLGNSQFTASLHDGTVEAATVELNECDYAFTAPDKPQRGRHDLQSVITHELGHVLGLGHSNNPAAIMYPSGGGMNVRMPQTEDKTSLAIIYFGRDAAQATREIPPAQMLSPPDPLALQLQWEPRKGSQTGHSPALPNPLFGPEAAAPANEMSRLILKPHRGRQIFVYTGEPTLLPPMTAAPSKHSTAQRRTVGAGFKPARSAR